MSLQTSRNPGEPLWGFNLFPDPFRRSAIQHSLALDDHQHEQYSQAHHHSLELPEEALLPNCRVTTFIVSLVRLHTDYLFNVTSGTTSSPPFWLNGIARRTLLLHLKLLHLPAWTDSWNQLCNATYCKCDLCLLCEVCWLTLETSNDIIVNSYAYSNTIKIPTIVVSLSQIKFDTMNFIIPKTWSWIQLLG